MPHRRLHSGFFLIDFYYHSWDKILLVTPSASNDEVLHGKISQIVPTLLLTGWFSCQEFSRITIWCDPNSQARLHLRSTDFFCLCRWAAKWSHHKPMPFLELCSLPLNPMFKEMMFVLKKLPAMGIIPQLKERRKYHGNLNKFRTIFTSVRSPVLDSRLGRRNSSRRK